MAQAHTDRFVFIILLFMFAFALLVTGLGDTVANPLPMPPHREWGKERPNYNAPD